MTELKDFWPEWEIESVLGRGSYGTVYKAVRNDYLKTEAAIKVISIPQNEEELESLRTEGYDLIQTRTYYQEIVDSFVHEIAMLMKMRGLQNIVSIGDYKVVERSEEVGWDIFIQMELLTPLKSFLADKSMAEGTWTEADTKKLGTDICSALEICRKYSIIHRDIKPENILVNENGDYKLGDFGVARRLENLSNGLSVQGSWPYMAPEVAQQRSYDGRADIYSLGLVLYQLMNRNKLPFLDIGKPLNSNVERQKALTRRLSGEPLPAPCDASPTMAKIILKACEYDPDRRFQSPTEMKNALFGRRVDPQRGWKQPLIAAGLIVLIMLAWRLLYHPPPPVLETPVPEVSEPVEVIQAETEDEKPEATEPSQITEGPTDSPLTPVWNPVEAIMETGEAGKITLPDEKSFFDSPQMMYIDSVNKNNSKGYSRAERNLKELARIPHGIRVKVLAEQNGFSCIIYQDRDLKTHAIWVDDTVLSFSFPGKVLNIGETGAYMLKPVEHVTAKWSNYNFEGSRQQYTVLSEPVDNCVQFTLDYRVVNRGSAADKDILGPRQVYISDGSSWTMIGEFDYPSIDAVHVVVNLPEPMRIEAVATVASCKKPDVFTFRQNVLDIMAEG